MCAENQLLEMRYFCSVYFKRDPIEQAAILTLVGLGKALVNIMIKGGIEELTLALYRQLTLLGCRLR